MNDHPGAIVFVVAVIIFAMGFMVGHYSGGWRVMNIVCADDYIAARVPEVCE